MNAERKNWRHSYHLTLMMAPVAGVEMNLVDVGVERKKQRQSLDFVQMVAGVGAEMKNQRHS